jgi:hypothetical protein
MWCEEASLQANGAPCRQDWPFEKKDQNDECELVAAAQALRNRVKFRQQLGQFEPVFATNITVSPLRMRGADFAFRGGDKGGGERPIAPVG